MKRLGLTGGIGSGKSTVATMLVDCGAALVDTDAIARSLTLPLGAAMPFIAEAFGPDVLDINGGLDRARMRQLVFGDDAAKARLEAIIHPLIGLECTRQAEAAADRIVVFDVPLLVESRRWRQRVERVLVIDAPEALQVDRVMARSNWTRETVLAVMASQASRRARLHAADGVIFNGDKTLLELEREVRSLWEEWAQSATR
ncbi:MAG: dephospho-CoA kinase [Comamonadaceae bacterium]|nr:MAG: dephospho-CoA kinase [Comamonadaceae bacterium]